MSNLSESISIKNIVNGLLLKEGKNNDDFARYLQVAVDGIRDMHIHDFDVVATKVVSVDSTTKTFNFPTDYVRYESVSTVVNGMWWTYTKKDELVPLTDDDSTTIQSTMPNVSDVLLTHGLTDGGGHNLYYFKEDRKNSRFIVSGFTPDVVVLRYVSNGLSSDGDFTIQGYAKMALEAWIRWRMSEYDNEPISHQDRKDRRYKEERRKMRMVTEPTVDEIMDAIYATTGQGTRR